MASDARLLDRGAIGFFGRTSDGRTPDLDDDRAVERGYLRLVDRLARLDLLIEDPFNGETGFGANPTPARGVVGATVDGGVVLLEVRGPYATHRFGGSAVSSTHYLARTVAGGFAVDRLVSTDVLGLTAHFGGLANWAGLQDVTEQVERDANGRITRWTMDLSSSDDNVHRLSAGRTLTIGTTWSVSGPGDSRQVSLALAVGCSARRPRSTWDLLEPLVHVQRLASLAVDGVVLASTGRAELHLADADGRERPWMWSSPLMLAAPGTHEPRHARGLPLFHLTDVGGPAGLARWVELAASHPRVVNPLVNPYRLGPSSPEVTVLELGAGMEYWVRVNRPSAWANHRPNVNFAQVLASKVGRHFNAWVGNASSWGVAFWDHYNALKHRPGQRLDDQVLHDLEASGRVLLLGALLDRGGRSKGPSRRLVRHHSLASIGNRLTELFT